MDGNHRDGNPPSHTCCQSLPCADADLFYSNQTDGRWSYPAVPASQQLRWDAWARLTEPLLATVPAVYVPGNHGECAVPSGQAGAAAGLMGATRAAACMQPGRARATSRCCRCPAELEFLRMPPDFSWKATFTAFNARYPGPQARCIVGLGGLLPSRPGALPCWVHALSECVLRFRPCRAPPQSTLPP